MKSPGMLGNLSFDEFRMKKGPADRGRDPDESLGSPALAALVLLFLLVILPLSMVLSRNLF